MERTWPRMSAKPIIASSGVSCLVGTPDTIASSCSAGGPGGGCASSACGRASDPPPAGVRARVDGGAVVRIAGGHPSSLRLLPAGRTAYAGWGCDPDHAVLDRHSDHRITCIALDAIQWPPLCDEGARTNPLTTAVTPQPGQAYALPVGGSTPVRAVRLARHEPPDGRCFSGRSTYHCCEPIPGHAVTPSATCPMLISTDRTPAS